MPMALSFPPITQRKLGLRMHKETSVSDRYVHYAPKLGTEEYERGKKQGELSLEHFHYLRALILGKYTFVDDVPPDRSRAQLFPRQGLEFTPYTDFGLEPILGEKLHPREDGTIHPEDIRLYHDTIKSDFKTVEGGILDAVLRDARAFLNIMLNYHSKAKTTGDPEWDSYFADLKARGFPKKNIDCMFFARESGCLDGDCPFRHDSNTTKSAREKVFEERRKYMREPTPRQLMKDSMRRRDAYVEAHDLDRFEDLPDEIEDEFMKTRARAFCAYPECGKPWLLTEKKSPLKACSKCKWAQYCSPNCQKKDWPRHKNEPCAPIEEIIKNDDLWSPAGTRKGTERFNINWGDA